MLIRGADGKLYKIGANGAELMIEPSVSAKPARMAAARAMDSRASADYHSARA